MKDDLISRQEVLALPKNITRNMRGEIVEETIDVATIKRLPPAQPGWIPVTERLPDRTDTYLVQVGINENGEGMHTEVRTAEWNVIWQTWYVHTTHCFVGDIIKWMPIPREGGQDG